MKRDPNKDAFKTGVGITPRPCIWDNYPTEVTKEGLLKCMFCKRTFQPPYLSAYKILESR